MKDQLKILAWNSVNSYSHIILIHPRMKHTCTYSHGKKVKQTRMTKAENQTRMNQKNSKIRMFLETFD